MFQLVSETQPDSVEASSAPEDSGLQCLSLIALLHGIAVDQAELRHEFGEQPFSTTTLLHAARHLGLTAKLVSAELARLDRTALPAVAVGRDGTFVVLARVEVSGSGGRVLIQRPGAPPEMIPLATFAARWSGELLLFTSRASYAREMSKFDFTWFIPSIVKYRRLLGEVLLISLALQLLGLAAPLFFQVVMDKVLVNRAISTLDVIGIGLALVTVFEALLGTIRTYVFSHTTSKLDVELGARLFRHLLQLPVSYFQARRVGDSVARIRELETIRNFLTGNALTVLLDLAFSSVFLCVMTWYSGKLTLIVVASIVVYGALSLLFTPILRNTLNEKFNRGAENQAFLVETVTGIDTVKEMAIEPRWNRQWENLLAAYVRSGLKATTAALMASGAVALVGKCVTLAIMWLGAWEVMDGHLTIGALIAFNMLSGQVAAPVLRLAQLWNDFQQVGISMQRLGDILNSRTELSARRTRLPRLRGAIEFDRATFRYRPDCSPAIRNVSFRIAPGEIVGIVGRSGSGKSTITKLVQRLHATESGRILIDQHDLASIDTRSLRHQIGVVPQEGTLFNRSVRENIALRNPGAALEAVIEAATLAGAHEFICDLPDGYDTVLGERGSGLSGGQRQRVAIARALMTDPRILILDEATSALDYESERAIQSRMTRICRGRTVLIVAHRLSAVRNADRILVMDRGEVVEQGSHDELVRRSGIYAQLHQLQVEGFTSTASVG